MKHRSPQMGAAAAFCFAFALLVATLPAAAQRLVISYVPASGTAHVTQSIDLGTGSVDWTEPGSIAGPVVVTSDGRYLLFRRFATSPGPLLLFVRDLLTNVTLPMPFDFEPRLAHPRHVAVVGLADVHSTGFGTTAGTLALLDASGLHIGGGCAAGTTVEFDLSTDAGTVAALCQSGDVVLLDAVSGQLLRTLAADPAKPIASLSVNHDGTRLFVTRRSGAASNEIAAVDAVSGLTLATTTIAPADATCRFAGITPAKTTAVMGCTWPVPAPTSIAGESRLLDLGSLTPGPLLISGSLPGRAVFRPDDRSVFFSIHHRLGFGVLNEYDVATGAFMRSSGTTLIGPFAIAFAPLAPVLGASVTGARVDLHWTLPAHSPAATQFVLEAGTATGLTDIGTLTLGPAEAISLPAVPSGTYVVRVRAANATGVGAASNEVTVVVP